MEPFLVLTCCVDGLMMVPLRLCCDCTRPVSKGEVKETIRILRENLEIDSLVEESGETRGFPGTSRGDSLSLSFSLSTLSFPLDTLLSTLYTFDSCVPFLASKHTQPSH